MGTNINRFLHNTAYTETKCELQGKKLMAFLCQNFSSKNNSYFLRNIIILISGLLFITQSSLFAQPGAPTDLYVISQDQSNELYWTASTGATDYYIYRSEDSITFNYIGSVVAPVLTYTDINLTNGKFYFYRVTAIDGVGESGFSNTDASTPKDVISTYMHFGGTMDYAFINDNQALKLPFPTQLFSIQCWVKLDNVSGQQTIIAREDNSTSDTYYTIYFSADKFVFWTPTYPAQNMETDPGVLSIEANTWYHIAITLDNGGTTAPPYTDNTLSLYVNGILQDQVLPTTNIVGIIEGPSSQPKLIFGAEEAPSGTTFTNYLNGSIAEVSIWDITLSQATIQANMNSRSRGDEVGLRALWHFDDKFNDLIYDYGKLNQNAQIVNNVIKISSHAKAIDDYATVQESSVNNTFNVRVNDTIEVPQANVITKIVAGYPINGTAIEINKDSISYTPDPGFAGIDTIKYLICDTTLLGDPYLVTDTAVVVIAVRCNTRTMLDWNDYTNGESPDDNIYSEEGLFTEFRLDDPNVIANSFNLDNRFQGTRSVVWQQTPGDNSEVSSTTLIFNKTVDQFCLNLLNIDYTGANKDSLIIDPYLNGNKIILDEGMFTLSSAVSFQGNNTFVGNSSVVVSSPDGNLEVCFLPAVDSAIITYGNSSNAVGNNQAIGIGNFDWCEIENSAPQFVDELNNDISFLMDTCLEDSLHIVDLKLLDVDLDLLTISEATALFGTISGIPSLDSSFTYLANSNYNGYDTIFVVVHDDRSPQLSDTLYIYMHIIPVNDAPSFTAGGDDSVIEDFGVRTVSSWATGISKGPANEGSQILTFTVTNNNNGLFSTQPVIDGAGNLTYTPATDSSGTAIVDVVLKDNGGTANGGIDSTVHVTFTITVVAVNDAPSFSNIGDQSFIEDGGAQIVNIWATGISAGASNESAQTLTFIVTNNNNALFSAQPAISATGELSFTPAADANGISTVDVVLKDNGGTANGGIDSTAHVTFTITISAVNDAPSFSNIGNQSVMEDAGPQSFSNWATGISAGPSNESGQTLTFSVINNNNGLFSTQPAISPAGELSFTPADDSSGIATVDVVLKDDGGVTYGGVDSTTHITFTITVGAVNDAPSFSNIGNQSVLEDVGAQTVSAWATGINVGPSDENGQTPSFIVTNDNTSIFSDQPAISPTGELTFTPAADANGSATVDVVLKDDGGTSNGGVDSTSHITFTITVDAINDAPSFTAGGDDSVIEDYGVRTVSNWATTLSVGPGNESSQNLVFIVTNTNNDLFSTQPAIDATGNLTYTPAADSSGIATVDVVLKDDGGITNGGIDSTSHQTFVITINPGNDAPTDIDLTNDQINENQVAGTSIGILSVTDIDVGDSHTYQVIGAESAFFMVDGDTLKTSAVFDYEDRSSYTVTIRVTDSQLASYEESFTIIINDQNEAPTDIILSKDYVEEGLPGGTEIGIFDTEDEDVSDAHVYELVAGTGDTDNSMFKIVGNALQTDAVFNSNVQNSFSIRVRTTDDGTGNLYYEEVITITIIRVNSAPTGISLNEDSIFENEDPGTLVGILLALDVDSTNTHTYTILPGDDGAMFSIIVDSILITSERFDYESDSILTLTIRTTDNYGEYYDSTFSIRVKNINEAPSFTNSLNEDIEFLEYSLEANETLSICPIVFDVDGDSTSFVYMATQNGNGILSQDFTNIGCVIFSPDTSFSGTEQAILVVQDNGIPALTDTLRLIFNITEPYINHPPIIVDEYGNSTDTLFYDTFANESAEICLNVYDRENEEVRLTQILVQTSNADILRPSGESLCFEISPEIDFIGQVYVQAFVSDNGIPELGDSVIISLWVEPKLEFSSAISPNEDGINEFLTIAGIDKFPDNKVSVFNRWGDIIYEKKGYDNQDGIWTGQSLNSFGSDIAPDGTYFYVLEITGYSKLIKGYVVLKR